MPRFRFTCAVLIAVAALPVAHGETLHAAVASNFADTLKDIAAKFQESTANTVLISAGSTGKHYAQIAHGASFHVFFAADAERPRLMEDEGLIVAGSRFTYALGSIVLWSPKPGYVDGTGAVLGQAPFRHLAIANPKLAPYGAAARELLEAKGLWEKLLPRIVQGENISQTHQFIASGNVELGFVALSQLQMPGREIEGSYWTPPAELYTPIDQQAVLLKDTPAARAFLEFVRGEAAAKIIHAYGYTLPKPKPAASAVVPADR